MSTTWFTSDLHFGHRLVAEHRGFADVEAHDNRIFDAWADEVGPDDAVWVLGDIAMSQHDRALRLLAGLPGRKRLILGNHDAAHPMHRIAYKWQRKYADVFALVAPFARKRIAGHDVALSHFPYVRDRGALRHEQWRLPNLGMPLIHGHTHGKEQLTVTPESVEVHVGLDAWDMQLVHQDEVAELLEIGRARVMEARHAS